MPRTPRREFDQRGAASGLGILETYEVEFTNNPHASRRSELFLSDSDIRGHLRMKLSRELMDDGEGEPDAAYSNVVTSVSIPNRKKPTTTLYTTPHHQHRASDTRTFTTRWKESAKKPPPPTPFGTSHRLTPHMGYVPPEVRNKPSLDMHGRSGYGAMSPTRVQFERARANTTDTMSPQKLRRRYQTERKRGGPSVPDFDLL
eukprot:TRINITY_DN5010_c2_g1_i1.p1 TRINITY_DN5010_c2_g1~~TRINITY_DN5010_c2_g1_i1.p1  ORF type:complete len:202 (+),score=23.35 TRINITY_DN5010_c2_g1_i1:37-642(+)